MIQANYPRRLIEVDLPIKRISAHARREKSIRHGHICTLHIWWARRPLAACRAVICAALWPDPADPLCPPAFREAAEREIRTFAKAASTSREVTEICDNESWKRYGEVARGGKPIAPAALRRLLLDFIADFAAWEASTNKVFLQTARNLTQAAHEALGGAPGTRPLVVDPFAGGGSIPLEALRVGADAFASDLNPVAVLLNKVVLEYIPKYGQRLADEVRKWGEWIKREAEKELAEFYPKDPDGATPIAYLWARTIQCEGPGCGAEIPLIRSTVFSRSNPGWHYVLKSHGATITVDIRQGKTPEHAATVAAGKALCPVSTCGYATPAKNVRDQLIRQDGGARHARLLGVLRERNGTRTFEPPSDKDPGAIARSRAVYRKEDYAHDVIPDTRPHKNTRGLSAVTRIGIRSFRDLYTERQSISLKALLDCVSRCHDPKWDSHFGLAVVTLLHCAASRLIFQNCSLSRWNAGRDTIEGAFGKQALQNTWDFAESNPLSGGPASWDGAVEWVLKVIDTQSIVDRPGHAERGKAQQSLLPDDSADALITDPPYFAAIPYGDLSDVFYVWEREFLRLRYPDLYHEGLVEKADELIVTNCQRGPSGESKDAAFYQHQMSRALTSQRAAVKPSGIGVIVFADSKTTAWEAMLGATIGAGWVITGSWPIDTELQSRTQAAGSASLQSSVHLVCRPRDLPAACLPVRQGRQGTPDGSLRNAMPTGRQAEVGDWREVLAELPKRIHDWLPRLAEEGVVGADAIFACLGPALEIFSRYSRVEKASGEQVSLREYLEHVWAAVSQEALRMVFEGADASGFEEDARLTAMWLWTLSTGNLPAGRQGGQNSAGAAEDQGEEADDEQGGGNLPALPDRQAGGRQGKKASGGYALEFDTARKIAQGLGAHLEKLAGMVEIKGDTARLLSVAERTKALFGKDQAGAPAGKRKKKDTQMKLGFAAELEAAEADAGAWGDKSVSKVGQTVLDRVHQTMILFAAGRSEALRRFLVEESVGRDGRFWMLAQALSALYPAGSDEKRWVDGVLARKKGLGF